MVTLIKNYFQAGKNHSPKLTTSSTQIHQIVALLYLKSVTFMLVLTMDNIKTRFPGGLALRKNVGFYQRGWREI